MWKCANCSHLELTAEKPGKCPVCGADAEKLIAHQVPGLKGGKTIGNLKMGFEAESKASVRNRICHESGAGRFSANGCAIPCHCRGRGDSCL